MGALFLLIDYPYWFVIIVDLRLLCCGVILIHVTTPHTHNIPLLKNIYIELYMVWVKTRINITTKRGAITMQTSTKEKYFERLSAMKTHVRSWLSDGSTPDNEESLQRLWNRVRDIENELIDGTDLNTIRISNKITAAEASVDAMKNRLLGIIDTPAEKEEEEVTAPDTELGAHVMSELGSIQGRLSELYAMIAGKHPVLVNGMPAVQELRTRSAEIGSTMQRIAKLSGGL